MKKLILPLLVSSFLLPNTSKGYISDFLPFSPIKLKEELSVVKTANTLFTSYKLIHQDINSILEFNKKIHASYTNSDFSTTLTLPYINGTNITFVVRNSEILSDDYIRNNPSLKTFKGISIDNKYGIRFTMSSLGFMGKITDLTTNQITYIQPLDHLQPENLVLYNYNDEKLTQTKASCNAINRENQELENSLLNDAKIEAALGDCQLRTFRFAVAATGEYTTWAGGINQAEALIANSVNNIAEIYERDATITFRLVLNRNLIFTDANNDPFQNTIDELLLRDNSFLLLSNIGDGNYDLGAVFGYGNNWTGGIAFMSSICTQFKGGIAVGLGPNYPMGSSGPIFDQSVAHEIAHQLGATHTMSANTGGCGGNINTATTIEAGGGSSIMAYAGVCTGLSYQNYSDHFFHAASLAQIKETLYANNCIQATSINNNSPITSVLNTTYLIPNNTPFKLILNATDNDHNGLLYSFDQIDALGANGTNQYPSATSVSGPLFRYRTPTSDNFRYFPALNNILNDNINTYEVLPTVARNINFKAVVRDNYADMGCVSYEDITVQTASCGNFGFTNLSNHLSLSANGVNTLKLEWEDAACVGTTHVNILFSTDGGKTFPYLVANNTPNDGSETIIIPNLETCNGRFMIEAVGNIYFNISPGTVSISSICEANGAQLNDNQTLITDQGNPALNLNLYPEFGEPIANNIRGTITNTNATGSLIFFDNNTNACSGPTNSNFYTTVAIYPATSNQYVFTNTENNALVMNLYKNEFDPNNPCENLIASSATLEKDATAVDLFNFVGAELCANQQYTLVLETVTNTTTSLPYNITYTGGTLNDGLSHPGVNYNYGYVIVEKNTNNIKSIQEAADLTNTRLFSGGEYWVYGISFKNTESIASLNSIYANTNFDDFRIIVNSQANGICAQLSGNYKTVSITNPLPINLIEFKGKINQDNNALIEWTINEDETLDYFELERSNNGNNFSKIATIYKDEQRSYLKRYLFEDKSLNNEVQNNIYYRLLIKTIDPKKYYSSIIQLNKHQNTIKFNIYPNPVEDNILNVKLADKGEYELTFFDALGRQILEQHVESLYSNELINIDLSTLDKGIYLLAVKHLDQSIHYKINKL